jgi:3-hydroxybutyryl-CoA dehydrogenase
MRVNVLGAGTMGSGIAQLASMNGHHVTCYDPSTASLDRGRRAVETSLARFVRAGKLTESESRSISEDVRFTDDLADAAGGAEVIVESVIEDLETKRTIIDRAAALADPGCLLGTNTSQLSITAIGAGLAQDRTPRLIGMHFFNPPVLMRLVELTRGQLTDDETTDRARAFAATMDREVVLLNKDMPGFITTRISGIVRLECLRILEEGVASAEDIDRACTLGLNLPMGPLALGDFNGLDTYLAAMDTLADSLGERFRPPQVLRNMVMAGFTGRKSGRGFYRYDEDGQRLDG